MAIAINSLDLFMNNSSIEVLLVEDDPEDVDLTQEALESSRVLIKLNVVNNGEEALAYLRQEGKFQNVSFPDLIWLDLNLPGMSGQEILQEIRRDRSIKHIPVVVLTTSDADEDILKSYQLGANCYVQKPVGIAEFQQMLSSIENFWFTVVKLPK